MTVFQAVVFTVVPLGFKGYMLLERVNHASNKIFQSSLQLTVFPPVPTNYQASYSADVFFTQIVNCIATGTSVINYTVVMDTSFFGTQFIYARLYLLDTVRTEMYFRLSDGSTSRDFTFADPELVVDGAVAIIRDSVIVINNPAQPVPIDTFGFQLGATIAGFFGVGFRASSISSRGVVEVIPSPGQSNSMVAWVI